MKRILSYGPELGREIRNFIKARKPGHESIPWGVDFLGRLEPFAASGKLLRGSVLCFTYEAFSGQPPDQTAIKAAMALELAHSGLLIHDDIMDDDELRRGQPSMHRQYQSIAERRNLPGAKRFGSNMAMSGGDAALFMALELLGKSQAGLNAKSPGDGTGLYDLFVEQMFTTCVGQMQDIYFEAGTASPPKQAIYDLMRAKTAVYTLALPLVMGGMLAGQPESVLRDLHDIGVDGGTIFQIRDDELGVMGDPAVTGKPVGSDIKEGKKTLLYHYLTKNCTASERDKLKGIFGNTAATVRDIDYVRGLVKQRNVTELIGKEVDRLQKNVLSKIDELPASPEDREELKNLVRFCAQRQF